MEFSKLHKPTQSVNIIRKKRREEATNEEGGAGMI
jgi:hypothetical protein